jgi:putative membrane protein insertion efficiency factor
MRRRLLASVALISLVVALDVRRPPEYQLTSRAALAAIHAYQSTLAPVYARMGAQCRFTPTCSHYSEACIRRYGAVRGGWLSVTRVVRCGPWTPRGTVDPPPESR